ncbi:hypothetical protein C2G38_2235585 [Gigaspora rosea]|uniref:Uncharacterized protein n=1 Tax=Gigaspora rosea TaxID=44941 RepID=A0A397TZ56_9GLOM|nr:hypothetical protein C2G38_2235585 [Gigaspora rosea]
MSQGDFTGRTEEMCKCMFRRGKERTRSRQKKPYFCRRKTVAMGIRIEKETILKVVVIKR